MKTSLVSFAQSAGMRKPVTQRVFAVVECMASSERPLSVSYLAVLLSVLKGSMHRIVNQLDTDGPLMPNAEACGHMQGPRSLNFGLISNEARMFVDRIKTALPFGLSFEIGSRVRANCSTPTGKLLLAHMPKRWRIHLLNGTPLLAYTPRTVTDPAQLEAEIVDIRDQGHSIEDQGFPARVIYGAVPVHDARGHVYAAIAA